MKEGRKAKCPEKTPGDELQDMSTQSIVCCAHLATQTYTAGVVWCDIGHEELTCTDGVV